MGIETTEALPGALAKKFEAFFRKHPPSFAKTLDSKQVMVGGKRYHYDNYDSIMKLFPAEQVLAFDLVDWFRSEPADKLEQLRLFFETTYRKDDIAKQKRKEDLYRRINGGDEDFDLPDPDYILDNLRPCRILGDKTREAGFRFIDRRTKKLTDYDFHSIAYALKRRLDREMIDDFMAHHIHVRQTFDPQQAFGIKKEPDSNNVYEYNRYEPPAWRQLDVKPALDPDIEALMSHLFKTERDREFVYTWIYHTLTSRAGTYLYLCGGQGSGKNTVASLITRLHGEGNSSHPKQDSFKSRFNYYLRDKTFVFFDEFNCRVRQDKDILKSIANKRIQIEGKGRDHEDIDLHCSYMLANNSLEAIGLDPIDRRFSVPDINDDSLVPVWGRDRIRQFVEKFEDDEWIAQFGFWILEEFKAFKFFPEEPYQTKRFEDIVIATARLGISDTLTKLLNREQAEFNYYEEREAFRRIHKGASYPNIADWQKFFREVRVGGVEICAVDGPRLVPVEMYRPRGFCAEELQ